jgi:translation initiation factor IF-1
MVRNISGGTGTKSLARKLTGNHSGAVPLPSNDLEKIAVVSKLHGAHCDVTLEDGSSVICHIRNKFRGRNKRGNTISVGTFVLVGLREWESSLKNSDLLFVYDSVPNGWSAPSENNGTGGTAGGDSLHDNFDFDFV